MSYKIYILNFIYKNLNYKHNCINTKNLIELIVEEQKGGKM